VNDLTKNILVFVVIIVVLLSVVQGLSTVRTGVPIAKDYSEFLELVRSGQVQEAVIEGDKIRFGSGEPLPYYTISPETDNNTLIGLLDKNDVTIGESGHVKADVTADTVRIDGEVVGDIKGVEMVIVSRSGRVNGNIVAPRVTLEDGAKFKGSIDMDPTEHPAAAKPSPLRSTSRSKPQSDTGAETADADASHASG